MTEDDSESAADNDIQRDVHVASEKKRVDHHKLNSWQSEPGLVYFDTSASSSKIAAFDLDWTLIATKSGAKFPQDKFVMQTRVLCALKLEQDWKFLYEKIIPEKLVQLQHSGFRIVIFSNQGGNKQNKVDDVTSKIHAISSQVCLCDLRKC